jgi:hypothetical protein
VSSMRKLESNNRSTSELEKGSRKMLEIKQEAEKEEDLKKKIKETLAFNVVHRCAHTHSHLFSHTHMFCMCIPSTMNSLLFLLPHRSTRPKLQP